MNIYLIGMPASGKSSVGKVLAKKINYEFIDIDKYIEKKHNTSVKDIFALLGEDGFRQIESDVLREFYDKTNYVISCGGGIVVNASNKLLMNGVVVLIDVKLSELSKRVLADKKNSRPLFETKTVAQLYHERKDKYDYFKDIKVFNYNIKSCVNQILEKLGGNV